MNCSEDNAFFGMIDTLYQMSLIFESFSLYNSHRCKELQYYYQQNINNS